MQLDTDKKYVMVPRVSPVSQQLYFGQVTTNFSDLSKVLPSSVFTGCIRELLLNNKTVGLNSGQPVGTNTLPKAGCAIEKSCSSSMCGHRGLCRTTWDGMECRCELGYQGDRCQNGKPIRLKFQS